MNRAVHTGGNNERQAPLLAALFLVLTAVFLISCSGSSPEIIECQPTPYDEIGPFYRPGAPIRSRVGEGYVLSGKVLSSEDCRVLPGSRLEFWLVNPQGTYDDAHRATLFADRNGSYRFESSRPIDYVGRPPHIHIMVTASGHERLITQHYPKQGLSEADFNLVLLPLPR